MMSQCHVLLQLLQSRAPSFEMHRWDALRFLASGLLPAQPGQPPAAEGGRCCAVMPRTRLFIRVKCQRLPASELGHVSA